MGDAFFARRLAWRILFLALAFALAFVHLLPVSLGPAGVPGPDLFVLLVFAWVLRRPEYVPALLIALVMLTADFLFLRPPGLWAAITVLGAEVLRAREAQSRDLPFLAEWGLVGIVLAAMTFGEAIVLLLFFVDQPPFGLTLVQLVFTILAYPLVVAVSAFGFGLRKAAPGAVDELGHRY